MVLVSSGLFQCCTLAFRLHPVDPNVFCDQELDGFIPLTARSRNRTNDMCDTKEKDWYAVLGASPSDSVQQLRHRYQQLALKHHPDRLEGEHSSEEFVELNEAWRLLSDQNMRRQYDLQRRAQELKQDCPVDDSVFLEDMIWDQGQCVYTYCCRCGGAFNISQKEVEEETRWTQQEEANQETKRRHQVGALVCCNTCSLSLHVTWPSNRKTQTLK
ncbi:DnaJ heat shock protein family (Hsp40) member C24 [Nothobranchius furzeri]|nr:dnaJ homolog subfamily C member 24 [Nothobranchius furzeri]KAF7215099.1 DnaJ heat shock protein family (Hsp40) member C24 [Nothobranchius furzeri]